MTSKRTTALQQIMQIEDKMSQVSKSKKYQKVQQYVRLLKNIGGGSIVAVENPDNMGAIVEVRKNSQQGKDYLASYERMLNEYDVLYNELGKRRNSLKKELFG